MDNMHIHCCMVVVTLDQFVLDDDVVWLNTKQIP